MVTIYGMTDSGNCYKPRLLMALTGRPFRHVEVSFLDGGTQDPAFTAKNPNAKVPLLEEEDGRLLPESNAMLLYLGEDTPFVPQDRFERALMASWMFFEQYSHEPYVAVRRSLILYRTMEATPEQLASTLTAGNKALGVMETRLAQSPFLAGETPSLADIALYAYTHVAPQGGFDLGEFPGIGRWLAAIEALPGYKPLDWHPGN
ncbi:glutathione S-transferase family protein [Acuticoccus kandeliae]|uniref:glutathione S-transferase family protein n=1 Tax=Acuticoccus kandeliae TaxID=2073160 RepID=UPI000D3E47FA|nr:glutathione S-transferase family protein [Acuticoccus kandeliae]